MVKVVPLFIFTDLLPCYSILKLVFSRVGRLLVDLFAFGFVGVFCLSDYL